MGVGVIGVMTEGVGVGVGVGVMTEWVLYIFSSFGFKGLRVQGFQGLYVSCACVIDWDC